MALPKRASQQYRKDFHIRQQHARHQRTKRWWWWCSTSSDLVREFGAAKGGAGGAGGSAEASMSAGSISTRNNSRASSCNPLVEAAVPLATVQLPSTLVPPLKPVLAVLAEATINFTGGTITTGSKSSGSLSSGILVQSIGGGGALEPATASSALAQKVDLEATAQRQIWWWNNHHVSNSPRRDRSKYWRRRWQRWRRQFCRHY